MPIYSYKCEICDAVKTEFRNMEHSDDSVTCECGKLMRRDIVADCFHAQSRGRLYSRPIHSDSLAISPTQIEEHKRLFPNIEIDSEGRPVFDNYKDHDAYLEATGFAKSPQKIKHRFPKKIKQRLL